MAKTKTRRIKFPHLLGSKWTAVNAVMGWRHFQVRVRQDRQGNFVWAQLQSVCDPTIELWVNAATLQNQHLWRAGWLSLSEEDPDGMAGLEDAEL
jgi:tryptophan-rich hypothetical protein